MSGNQEKKKLKSASKDAVKNTPTSSKRQNDELEPNTPSPLRQDGILKLRESKLLIQIRTIVTEVVQHELKTKVEELEAKVDSNTFEIDQIKLTHNNAIQKLEDKQSTELQRT